MIKLCKKPSGKEIYSEVSKRLLGKPDLPEKQKLLISLQSSGMTQKQKSH
jgi:hypothetical protein